MKDTLDTYCEVDALLRSLEPDDKNGAAIRAFTAKFTVATFAMKEYSSLRACLKERLPSLVWFIAGGRREPQ